MYLATVCARGSPVPQSPTTTSRAVSLIGCSAGRGLNGWLPLARCSSMDSAILMTQSGSDGEKFPGCSSPWIRRTILSHNPPPSGTSAGTPRSCRALSTALCTRLTAGSRERYGTGTPCFPPPDEAGALAGTGVRTPGSADEVGGPAASTLGSAALTLAAGSPAPGIWAAAPAVTSLSAPEPRC